MSSWDIFLILFIRTMGNAAGKPTDADNVNIGADFAAGMNASRPLTLRESMLVLLGITGFLFAFVYLGEKYNMRWC
jgi:hypothetical protein